MPIVPIIHADQLNEILATGIVLIDARSGPDARERYSKQHLKGAFHVDLDTQLATVKENPADGGRHPLPKPSAFSSVLESLGISRDSHVVVYDDKNGANAAARFWWMMRAAGHIKIQVLNGGLNAALTGGIPLAHGIEHPAKLGKYGFDQWSLPTVGIEEVAKASEDTNTLIIDVREKERFDGIREPIDLVAGHIPNAVNIFFASNLDSNGLFHAPEELNKKYTDALHGIAPRNVIVHCGSGVTACHTLLALEYAGIEGANLYVGSWSEWSRNY